MDCAQRQVAYLSLTSVGRRLNSDVPAQAAQCKKTCPCFLKIQHGYLMSNLLLADCFVCRAGQEKRFSRIDKLRRHLLNVHAKRVQMRGGYLSSGWSTFVGEQLSSIWQRIRLVTCRGSGYHVTQENLVDEKE